MKGSKKQMAADNTDNIYMTIYPSTDFGNITLASDGENLVGLWMDGQKYYAATVKGNMERKDDLPIFAKTKEWLDRYFAGENPKIEELPLAPKGSEFRQRVWKKLIAIPYGSTTTYGDIAREIAREDGKDKVSAQAVGGAVGHNPISIIIPCHRVVGADRSLTGYAGGLDKKVRLLTLEGLACVTPKTGGMTYLA